MGNDKKEKSQYFLISLIALLFCISLYGFFCSIKNPVAKLRIMEANKMMYPQPKKLDYSQKGQTHLITDCERAKFALGGMK